MAINSTEQFIELRRKLDKLSEDFRRINRGIKQGNRKLTEEEARLKELGEKLKGIKSKKGIDK